MEPWRDSVSVMRLDSTTVAEQQGRRGGQEEKKNRSAIREGENVFGMDEAFKEVFFHSLKEKNWQLAEQVAKKLFRPSDRIGAFSVLTKAYVYEKESEKVGVVAQYIFESLASPQTIWEISAYFLEHKQFEEALFLIEALPDAYPKTWLLIRVANASCKEGQEELGNRAVELIHKNSN